MQHSQCNINNDFEVLAITNKILVKKYVIHIHVIVLKILYCGFKTMPSWLNTTSLKKTFNGSCINMGINNDNNTQATIKKNFFIFKLHFVR